VRSADWERDRDALEHIRAQVFVREQQVPESLEWDGLDSEALHVIAESSEGEAIGTARLLPSGQIGRMAVLHEHRGRGVGTRLLLSLMEIAGESRPRMPFLNAQSAVIDFYRRLGFEAEGPEFDEAGIAHRRMLLRDPRRLLEQNLAHRRLGIDSGVLALDDTALAAYAVASLAAQAGREVCLSSADLEAWLYDRAEFLSAVRALALARRGQPVLRVLLRDGQAPVRHGHRLVELSRALSSAVEVRVLPAELADQQEGFVVADETGYFLHRAAGKTVADFHAPARARELKHGFDQLWQQSAPSAEMRRLHL
jgi:predicted GNAT family N-acyltransferase